MTTPSSRSLFRWLPALLAITTYVLSAPTFAQDLTAKLTGKPTTSNTANGALLEPTTAFRPQLRQRDPFTAELKFDIAPGYYLYQGRIQVEEIQTNAKPITSGKKASVIRPILAQSPPPR